MKFSLKKSGGDAPPAAPEPPKNDAPSGARSMFGFRSNPAAPAPAAPAAEPPQQSRSMFGFRSSATDEGIEAEAMPLPPPAPPAVAASSPEKKSPFSFRSSKALPPPPPPAVAASSPEKKSPFSSFGRSKEPTSQAGPAPAVAAAAAVGAAGAVAVAATPEKKSRFGFGSKSQSQASATTPETAATAAPTPSPQSMPAPKQKSKSKAGKKAKSTKKQQSQVSRQLDYDEPTKAKKRCCSIKLLVGSLCTLVLAAVGVVVWRYGPWSKDKAVVESLAIPKCDGCCNGSPANCALPVNEVLTGMVHRAHSSSSNGFVGASNSRSLEEALVAGYRGLSLSTCTCESLFDLADNQLLERDPEWGLEGSNLGFCHQPCGMGVRDPKDVLTNLRTFVETNVREVLILEVDMTGDSGADFRTALRASGLLDYVYAPDEEYYIRTWPTLQALIDANTRVLIFGSGDTMESCKARECEDKILRMYDHVVETYAEDGIETCDLTVSGDLLVGYMQMNHYSQPRFGVSFDAKDTNTYSTLEARFADCEGKRYPSILSVERWDEGEVLDFVSAENSRKNRVGGEYTMSPEEREGVEGLFDEPARRSLRG